MTKVLPPAAGNTWTYQDAATSETVSVAVEETVFNNNVYRVLQGFGPDPLFVRANESGNIVFRDRVAGTDVSLASFQFVRCVRLQVFGRGCLQVVETQEQRVTHTGPIGTWSALENTYFNFACINAQVSGRYVENIGMVPRVVTTASWPMTFYLIHARLGALTITAGQSGSFTLAVLPAPPHFLTSSVRFATRRGLERQFHGSTTRRAARRLAIVYHRGVPDERHRANSRRGVENREGRILFPRQCEGDVAFGKVRALSERCAAAGCVPASRVDIR